MLIWILISVIAVSLASLIGIIFIYFKEKILKKILTALISLASGAMLGGAFLHLLPESAELGVKNIWIYPLIGILVFFILEKFLFWRHCHTEKCRVHTFAYLNLIGDGVHNFIDGLIIASSYIINLEVGIATTIAVLFHEIPQEIGDFGILVYSGMSRFKALLYNFLFALTAVIGALIGYFIREYAYIQYVIPITAGGFIYIAASDLIPELKKTTNIRKSLIELAFLIIGIVIMLFI